MDLANRLLIGRGVRGGADAVGAPHRVPAAVHPGRRPRRRRRRRGARRLGEGGTVAVIAPVELHAAITASLADLGAVADAAEALDAPIGVLRRRPTPRASSSTTSSSSSRPGSCTPDSAGLRLLYVTLTRATQTLTVVHSEGLPEALAP